MNKKEEYLIRKMTEDEVSSIAIEWAAREGWNPGLYDAACYYKTDPNGFLIGFIGNEPVSCISAVAYNERFGFIGFYIVKPEQRGKGYGKRIWEAAMAYLSTQDIGLDGVVSQQDNYLKSGFRFVYNNIRYEGIAKNTNKQFEEIVLFPDVSFEDILQYDTRLFPAPRPQFLDCWVKQHESKTFAAVEEGRIAGYGVIRKCRDGYKIGPLFANSAELAEKLFAACSNSVEPGTKIYLDTPEINKAAVALAENHSMSKVFETARMYTKLQPVIDIGKIFGVTTFELG